MLKLIVVLCVGAAMAVVQLVIFEKNFTRHSPQEVACEFKMDAE